MRRWLVPVRSGAGDLAGLDARGAHVHPLGGGTDLGPHPLDVGVPAPLGASVRVGDVVPETGTLAADIAGGSHGALLEFQPGEPQLPGSRRSIRLLLAGSSPERVADTDPMGVRDPVYWPTRPVASTP